MDGEASQLTEDASFYLQSAAARSSPALPGAPLRQPPPTNTLARQPPSTHNHAITSRPKPPQPITLRPDKPTSPQPIIGSFAASAACPSLLSVARGAARAEACCRSSLTPINTSRTTRPSTEIFHPVGLEGAWLSDYSAFETPDAVDTGENGSEGWVACLRTSLSNHRIAICFPPPRFRTITKRRFSGNKTIFLLRCPPSRLTGHHLTTSSGLVIALHPSIPPWGMSSTRVGAAPAPCFSVSRRG
ncbi:hypothetical protein BS50DRAFT_223879 [Corynespora cassiicola Philippines]|uniref:Uncharacterized protein n=1 Tax=Corynespora cassiicola Philippines TaxID=1448308 RepID=A0A2T2N2U7_CORCC|nr:hypothetical protein BS50DRAFT_223879 [Corynespora cassiicola Philippines]